MDVLKSCCKYFVCKVLWHILLTILFKVYSRGIKFTSDRTHVKIGGLAGLRVKCRVCMFLRTSVLGAKYLMSSRHMVVPKRCKIGGSITSPLKSVSKYVHPVEAYINICKLHLALLMILAHGRHTHPPQGGTHKLDF